MTELYRKHPAIELFGLSVTSYTLAVIGAIGEAPLDWLIGLLSAGLLFSLVLLMGMASEIHEIYGEDLK